MDLSRFNADDIHELRIELRERRSKMSPEDAERDFRESVERGRRAIEACRTAIRERA